MKRRKHTRSTFRRVVSIVCGLFFLLAASALAAAQPSPAAISAYDSYVRSVESRLAQQHGSAEHFLANASPGSPNALRLQQGELILEQLTPAAEASLPSALLHHWRGTAFVPGANIADFERLLRDFSAYPRIFGPQVLRTTVLQHQGDHCRVTMRVRQRHVLTVVLDSTYNVAYHRLDAFHGYSLSASTQISEIDSPGSSAERALGPANNHGFLWRMNTYWTYEQRDGGLYLQVESVSLSRSIPFGLGWVVRPFVESVPRESLQFTLRSARNALQSRADQARTTPTANPRAERTQ